MEESAVRSNVAARPRRWSTYIANLRSSCFCGIAETKPTVNPRILLGTSSFTASGWEGSFYPKGLRSSDYLSYYADRFHTVEVDATYYACPTPRTVSNWAARTPENFIFSVKVPQTITHEKVLVDCAGELQEFLTTMDLLGPKLGPMVFQFPAFDR